MMMRSMRLIPLFAGCMLTAAMAAQPIYKCSAGGKTSYSDRPCAAGAATVLAPPAAGIRPEGAESVTTQDSRTLLALEKLRMKRDQDDARADRAHARTARAAAAKHKQCERLRLRAQWAAEDLTRARGKGQDAARIKARRAAQTMAVECPA
jgi:hypothetical protein